RVLFRSSVGDNRPLTTVFPNQLLFSTASTVAAGPEPPYSEAEHAQSRAMSSPIVATCPICEGTGWKSATANGGPRRVVRCDCALQARGSRLLAAARIPRRYEERDLANFDLFPGADASLQHARLVAAAFIE